LILVVSRCRLAAQPGFGQPFGVPRRESDVHGAADRASFEQFVSGSSSRMLTMAMLLTGHNRADAEDLLQMVLERAFRRWPRICRTGDPAPYVRQMLVNASVDRWRLLRRRPEQPFGSDDGPRVAAGLSGPDQSAAIADQDLLWRALAQLPPGQRAVLVLRYYEDLTEAQTAAVLGCSVGAVKAQASRALAKLRRIVGIADNGTQVPGEQKLTDHQSPRGVSHG
jgi:RNA polymerase sigma-70 factor (sigma-E family)